MSLGQLIIAAFTAPQQIGITPQSMLWLLPLVAALTIVYKASKLPTIKAGNFCKETGLLFCSIIIFIIVAALSLHLLVWLIIE